MRSAAMALLGALDEEQRRLAAQPFIDHAARRWLEYRPQHRPGACIAELSVPGRKAAHRLLATGLSEHAYAQAMGIIALEEVLDRQEDWQRGRHSGDYWVNVFGDPAGDQPWSWRFEGHHLSVTMTVARDEISPAPVFLGANPACVSYAGRPVSRPLAPEEDLVRALLDAMGAAGRSAAVVASQAPDDIHTSTSPRAREGIEPLGVPAARLGSSARALLAQLVGLYLDRLPAELPPVRLRASPAQNCTSPGRDRSLRAPGTTTGYRAMTCSSSTTRPTMVITRTPCCAVPAATSGVTCSRRTTSRPIAEVVSGSSSRAGPGPRGWHRPGRWSW